MCIARSKRVTNGKFTVRDAPRVDNVHLVQSNSLGGLFEDDAENKKRGSYVQRPCTKIVRSSISLDTLLAALASPFALRPPTLPPPPVKLTAQQDRQRLMDILHITTIPSHPDNNDETKADPYPNLPILCYSKNGARKLRPPICGGKVAGRKSSRTLKARFTGRPPKQTPKVTWEVTSTTRTSTVITKQLLGHVDNSGYPQVTVDIGLTLSTPINATRPVLVMMQFASPGFGFGPGRGGARQPIHESRIRPLRLPPTSPLPARAGNSNASGQRLGLCRDQHHQHPGRQRAA